MLFLPVATCGHTQLLDRIVTLDPCTARAAYKLEPGFACHMVHLFSDRPFVIISSSNWSWPETGMMVKSDKGIVSPLPQLLTNASLAVQQAKKSEPRLELDCDRNHSTSRLEKIRSAISMISISSRSLSTSIT